MWAQGWTQRWTQIRTRGVDSGLDSGETRVWTRVWTRELIRVYCGCALRANTLVLSWKRNGGARVGLRFGTSNLMGSARLVFLVSYPRIRWPSFGETGTALIVDTRSTLIIQCLTSSAI